MGTEKKGEPSICILFLIFIISVLLSAGHFSLNADEPQKALSEINKKIDETNIKVKETKQEEVSLSSELERIAGYIKTNTDEIRKYGILISEKKAGLDALAEQTTSLEAGIRERKKLLTGRLERLYKFSRNETAFVMISSRDFKDLARRSRYLGYLAEYDRKLIEDFGKAIDELNQKKGETEALKTALESDRKKLSDKTAELETLKKKKDTLLASAKKKRGRYEKDIAELTKASKRLRAMIKRLSRLSKEGAVPDKGFEPLKGMFAWPVNGEIRQRFGKYIDPATNIPVYRSGVEISTSPESQVHAILDGKVVFADSFKGYGLLVIIDHGGGYHSLYGQLSDIFFPAGAIIKKYAAIGRTGELDTSGSSLLYFEIRHNGKPVDPIQWLQKNN
ncbi:MAG: peptidoglycan DD-metalloendopeptidase family protein [Nitrospirae bacterium]|nr:peptidoglycan DD-metalloendopeptidase family protein [Nitrospirota bacterium]